MCGGGKLLLLRIYIPQKYAGWLDSREEIIASRAGVFGPRSRQ